MQREKPNRFGGESPPATNPTQSNITAQQLFSPSTATTTTATTTTTQIKSVDKTSSPQKLSTGIDPPNPYYINFTKWLGLIKAPTLHPFIPTPLFEGILHHGDCKFIDKFKEARLRALPSPTTEIGQLEFKLLEARLRLECIILSREKSSERSKKTTVYKLAHLLENHWTETSNTHSDGFLFTIDLAVALMYYRDLLVEYLDIPGRENWTFFWPPFFTGLYGELLLIRVTLSQTLSKLASIFLTEEFDILNGFTKGIVKDDPLPLKRLKLLVQNYSKNQPNESPEVCGFWNPKLGDGNSRKTVFTNQILLLRSLYHGAAYEIEKAIAIYGEIGAENELNMITMFPHLTMKHVPETTAEPRLFATPPPGILTDFSTQLSRNSLINQILFDESSLTILCNDARLQARLTSYLYYQITFLFLASTTSPSTQHKAFYQILATYINPILTLMVSVSTERRQLAVTYSSHSFHGKAEWLNYIQYHHSLTSQTRILFESLTFSHIILFAWAKKDYATVTSIVSSLKECLIGKTSKGSNAVQLKSSVLNISEEEREQSPFSFYNSGKQEEEGEQAPNPDIIKSNALVSQLRETLVLSSPTLPTNRTFSAGVSLSVLTERLSQSRLNDNTKSVILEMISYLDNQASTIWREPNTRVVDNMTLEVIKTPFTFPEWLASPLEKPFVFDAVYMQIMGRGDKEEEMTMKSEDVISLLSSMSPSGNLGDIPYERCNSANASKQEWEEILKGISKDYLSLKNLKANGKWEELIQIPMIWETVQQVYANMGVVVKLLHT